MHNREPKLFFLFTTLFLVIGLISCKPAADPGTPEPEDNSIKFEANCWYVFSTDADTTETDATYLFFNSEKEAIKMIQVENGKMADYTYEVILMKIQSDKWINWDNRIESAEKYEMYVNKVDSTSLSAIFNRTYKPEFKQNVYFCFSIPPRKYIEDPENNKLIDLNLEDLTSVICKYDSNQKAIMYGDFNEDISSFINEIPEDKMWDFSYFANNSITYYELLDAELPEWAKNK